MDYIVHFDVAALIVATITCIFFSPKQSIPGEANRLFRALVVFAMIGTSLDIFTVIQYRNAFGYSMVILYVTNVVYLLVQNATALILIMYARSFAVSDKSNIKRVWLFSSIPYLIMASLVISSAFTKLIFYFDDDRVYQHGPLHIMLYVVSSTYILGVIGILARYRKDVGKRRLTAICAFVALILVGMIIQMFLSKILVTHFCSACAALVMYLALQTPESDKDGVTGLYNRESLITAVSDAVRHNSPFAIISVLPDSTKSVTSVLGMEAYNAYIKSVGDYIAREFFAPVYLFSDDSIVFLLAVQDRVGPTMEHMMERFKYPWNIGGVELTRTPSCSIVRFPDVATDTEDVLEAVGSSIEQMRKEPVGTVINVTEAPLVNKRLDELEKQKLILEAESREAMLAKEKAEKSDREKSMFLANMSHEIRTPMNAIIGLTEMILRDDINDRVRQNANDIKGAGDSLLGIINDILDISKVESGKMELLCEEYSVRKLITDIVTLISTRINSKAVEFKVYVDTELPEKLIGDETRVRQIFVNILNNAAKFTVEGSVSLSVRGEEADGKYILKASVEDTGCGIKESDMDRLFSSFARIESTANHGIEGTGLGLPLSKKMLVMMGGDISVESTYGVGSRFSFEIPQEICEAPAIVREAENLHANVLVLCENNDQACCREVTQLCEALDTLKINYRSCNNDVDTQTALMGRTITHVFTFNSAYRKYSDLLKKSGNPTIILFDEENLSYDVLPNVVILHNPVYSLNVLRLIEGVKNTAGTEIIKFTAPEAKVLAVDDNLVNLKVIEGLLKCFGIRIATASSGMQAIEIASQEHFHVIFMDHMMPGMDGVEAMNRIRKIDDYYKSAPIVALTANAVNGVRNMFVEAGFSEYLSKPVDLNHLAKCLLTFLPMDLISQEGAPGAEPGIASESSVPERVDVVTIPGVNTALGITNCGESVEKYREQLETFCSTGQIQIEQMEKLRNSESLKTLKIEFKTLKNMAATLGAKTVSDMAAGLEQAAAAGDMDMVSGQFDTMISEYDKLLTGIKQYLNGTTKETGTAPVNNGGKL